MVVVLVVLQFLDDRLHSTFDRINGDIDARRHFHETTKKKITDYADTSPAHIIGSFKGQHIGVFVNSSDSLQNQRHLHLQPLRK